VDARDPGCVLLDVRMPGMKGPELYRTMLERDLRLPVIFLTAHGDVPTSENAMKMGAVDFLEKPVSAEVLVGAIRVADRARRAGTLAGARAPRDARALRAIVAARGRGDAARDRGPPEQADRRRAGHLGEDGEGAPRQGDCRRCRRARVPELLAVCRAAGVAEAQAP
jgi:DNA-binding response OmpR family regulator